MFQFAHYLQECPVCGRPLRIRYEYAGRRVVCEHCRGRFVAAGPSEPSRAGFGDPTSLVDRADDLIRRADRLSVPRAASS